MLTDNNPPKSGLTFEFKTKNENEDKIKDKIKKEKKESKKTEFSTQKSSLLSFGFKKDSSMNQKEVYIKIIF